MNDKAANAFRCQRCGRPLSGGEPRSGGGALCCEACGMAVAEEQIAARRGEREASARRPRRRLPKNAVKVALIAACASVIIFQLGSVRSGFRDKKPIRLGPYDTDAAADRCIRNLWNALSMLQEGKPLDPSMACPASRRRYRVEYDGKIRTVFCPSPELHRAASLSAGGKRRIPVLRR